MGAIKGMPHYATESERIRNHFYRDNYRRLIKILLLCLFVIVMLVGVIFYLVMTIPSETYYASTEDGRVIPLKSYESPRQVPRQQGQ